MIMPDIGREGQEKISQSKVGVIGAGGLGSSVLYYIVAAGVNSVVVCSLSIQDQQRLDPKELTLSWKIVDNDEVDESNLHRQILHSEREVGRLKTDSAKERLNLLNSSVIITTVEERINSKNAIRILKDVDIIVDCSDNAPTRYLLNDVSIVLGKVRVQMEIDENNEILMTSRIQL